MIKVIKEESVISEQDDETLEVDLSQLPFDDRQDAEGIEIAITGKNFETLYRLNQKYEKIFNKPNTPPKGSMYNVNNTNEKAESLVEYKEIVDENQSKFGQFKAFHDAFRLVLKYCSIYARCSPVNHKLFNLYKKNHLLF